MTNGDKIRTLTDEQLAKIINGLVEERATLYLEYGDGYVEEIPDPYRTKHMAVCMKTGQPIRMG